MPPNNLAVFLMLAASLHVKACAVMARRLDPDALRQPTFEAADAFLIVSVLLGIRRLVVTVVSILVSPESQGLWPWLFAFLAGIVIVACICRI